MAGWPRLSIGLRAKVCTQLTSADLANFEVAPHHHNINFDSLQVCALERLSKWRLALLWLSLRRMVLQAAQLTLYQQSSPHLSDQILSSTVVQFSRNQQVANWLKDCTHRHGKEQATTIRCQRESWGADFGRILGNWWAATEVQNRITQNLTLP